MKPVACLLRLVFLCVYIYTIYYDLFVIEIPWRKYSYGGKLKYLTFWNLWIQLFLFTVCFINDLIGTDHQPEDLRKPSILQRIRDYVFIVIALPVGLFVVTSFWLIYAYNRELIYPRILDAYIPSWINHTEHSTVVAFLLVELMLTNHRCPTLKRCLKGMTLFASVYGIWVLWIAYYAEIWVYPILRVLAMYQRITFILVMYMYFIVLSVMCFKIKQLVWGKQPASVAVKKFR